VFSHITKFSSPLEIWNYKRDRNSTGQNRTLRFVKLDSLVFPNRTETKINWVEPASFNRYFSPFIIKTNSLLLRLPFLLHHHECEPKEEIQIERVRGWSTGHVTIVKAKAAETHITVPLLHGCLFIVVSYYFFKWLNFWAFFTLKRNGGTRGAACVGSRIPTRGGVNRWF
jgi:hypothetical protein